MDIAAFLARYTPFDGLDEAELARVASRVEIAHFPAGEVILRQAGTPARFLYVIRKGAVELLDELRVLDLLGEGEVFGEFSLLAHASPTLSARAHEDTLCYLIEEEPAEELLETSAGMAFIVAAMRRRIERVGDVIEADRADNRYAPVRTLIRRPPVVCEASAPVAEAARLMAEQRVSSLLVPHGGRWGIITDRDIRSRVVARRRSLDTPVGEIMSFPAKTVSEDAMVWEVLLEMLHEGVHRFPVTRPDGSVAGLVTDTDLMGLGRESPFALRSAIERARDEDEVARAGHELPATVCRLVEARIDPVDIGRATALIIDTLTRRLIELAVDRLGDPPTSWAWLALGSAGRREQALRTDQDHALAFEPRDLSRDDVDAYFGAVAEAVTAGLEAASIPRCPGGAMAVYPEMRRSTDEWVEAFRRWLQEFGAKGSEAASIVFDLRHVAGPLDIEPPLEAVIRTSPGFTGFLRRLAQLAVEDRPPTGFFRDFVVEARGDHVGRLDVKRGGIQIVSSLARAYAMRAGVVEQTTLARLRGAEEADVIDAETREGLEEAFRFLWGVRLEHQVEQVREELPPDDFLDPGALGPVARRGLKAAFRVIGRAQRDLSAALRLTTD